jgi:hypothetical protein
MIKIELSRGQFKILLAESDTFRDIVAVLVEYQNKAENPLDFWITYIRKTFPEGATNKIPPIKWIKEQVAGNYQALESFKANGYPYDEGKQELGLVSAKKFIESCF